MMEIIESGAWLPLLFAGLMGLSMLIYAVLDGYDLGVGVLVADATPDERNIMIASIGPFWDANETWLVLGVGLLLVAFPMAHGIILSSLYLPVAVMLIGLIMRGVAFEFRAKAKAQYKKAWNLSFFVGSFLTAFSQGYMLGSYILGFQSDVSATGFSILVGFCVVAGYCLIGSCWLIMKTSGELQLKSIKWARKSLWGAVVGILFISLSTPMVSERIFDKWFTWPEMAYLAPIPIITALLVILVEYKLYHLPKPNDRHCWVPFVATIGIFILCFSGLAYSFYPYIIPEKMLITQAASAHQSLMILLVGALIVFPVLIGYTFVAYKVFHGKAETLRYD